MHPVKQMRYVKEIVQVHNGYRDAPTVFLHANKAISIKDLAMVHISRNNLLNTLPKNVSPRFFNCKF